MNQPVIHPLCFCEHTHMHTNIHNTTTQTYKAQHNTHRSLLGAFGAGKSSKEDSRAGLGGLGSLGLKGGPPVTRHAALLNVVTTVASDEVCVWCVCVPTCIRVCVCAC